MLYLTWYAQRTLTRSQGVNGLTARDIKLIVEGGFNTVESIAYTYVSHCVWIGPATNNGQATASARANKGHLRTKGLKTTCRG